MAYILDRIKLLVIGIAIGLLAVNPSAQPNSPGFNIFKAVSGSVTAPPYAFASDGRTGLYLVASGHPAITVSGTSMIDITTARVLVGGPLQLGSTAAQSGLVRLTNTGSIAARNAANSADRVMLLLDASNVINIGDSNTTGLKLGSGVVSRPSVGTFFLCVSSTGAITASAGACSGS
jgi:hypothetical protein